MQSANGDAINAFTRGSGSVAVTGSGSVFSGGGFGIIAISGTAGGVTVSGSGAVTSTASNAIVAQILDPANNGAVLVERSGPITGAAGIAALTPGGGAVTVNVSNDVTATGTAATAIDVGGAGGLASVNVAGGTILATGAGISAISTGNGGVRVNMTGGQVGTAAQRTGGIGISTFTQGTAGDINITANSVFSTGDGIAAQFVNPASNGSANVGINAGATVNSSAGVGVNLQGGINNTIANLGTVSGTTAVQTASGRTTIINTGSMIGTGGTAVQLAGANNLFVMDGPTSALTGQAIGSGTDTFRLGGGGSNTFNAGQIGAGWTLLDKAGSSTWTLTGTATYGGPDHGQRRHTAGERLACLLERRDGCIRRDARRYRHGGFDHDQQRRQAFARQLDRHDHHQRQSHFRRRGQLHRRGRAGRRGSHQRDRQRVALRHAAGDRYRRQLHGRHALCRAQRDRRRQRRVRQPCGLRQFRRHAAARRI